MSFTINKILVQRSIRYFAAMKKSPIYTRTGDKGTTSLYNGERKPKTDPTFETLGLIDNLNSQIGFAKEQWNVSINSAKTEEDFSEIEQLEHIQSRLFEIGSHVATPRDSAKGEADKKIYTAFDDAHIDTLEKWIDEHDSGLEPLKNFILPGGGLGSASLHLCRTSCRTVERSLFHLIQDGKADDNVGRYINRLSDYFFILSRVMAKKWGAKETNYVSIQKKKFLEEKEEKKE